MWIITAGFVSGVVAAIVLIASGMHIRLGKFLWPFLGLQFLLAYGSSWLSIQLITAVVGPLSGPVAPLLVAIGFHLVLVLGFMKVRSRSVTAHDSIRPN